MSERPIHKYCLHGLELHSRFEVPELAHARLANAPHVLDPSPVGLHLEDVPETIAHSAVSKDGYLIGDGEILAVAPGGTRCLISHGNKVSLHPGNANPAAARFYALSAGLGTLLHQRRYMPLHCAAVSTPAGCVAFVGNAGDGKSTLAASFSCRGFKLFTDDRLTIHHTSAAPYLAAPALPVFHLFENSTELAGLDDSTLASDSYRFGKHVHLAPDRYTTVPAPMAALYFTDWHEDTEQEAQISPLGPIDAMMRLRRDVSLAHLVELLGSEARFMKWASGLCSSVACFSFKRPKNPARHNAGMDLIVRHIQDRFST